MAKITNVGMITKLSKRTNFIWFVIAFLFTIGVFSITTISQQIVIINERLSDLERKDKTVHISVERWYDKDAKKYGYKFIELKEEDG